MEKREYKTDKENYDELRVELKDVNKFEIARLLKMRNVLHRWAIKALEDELESRKKKEK